MKTFTNWKRKGQIVAYGFTPLVPVAGRKFPQYSEGYLENFAVFQDVDVFIARFIAEPLLIFCGTADFLFGKHWSTAWISNPGPSRLLYYAARCHIYKIYNKN